MLTLSVAGWFEMTIPHSNITFEDVHISDYHKSWECFSDIDFTVKNVSPRNLESCKQTK